MTPLHLAVNAGSIRIVSKLLKLGVEKENKDEKGKTPLDLANSYKFKNIIKLIEYEDGLAEFCNIKQPTYNIKRRKLLMYFFISLYLTIHISTFIFVVPYIKNMVWIAILMILFL